MLHHFLGPKGEQHVLASSSKQAASSRQLKSPCNDTVAQNRHPSTLTPPCRSPPLVVPRGGGGGPSLGQPKIFRCGSLCCCVGGCVVRHYHLHPLHSWQDILLTFAEMELDSTTMFPPGTSVMFIRSTGEPVLAQVVGHSEHGDAYRRISYDRDGKTVLHDRASVRRLSLPRAPSPPRPAQSEASSSTRAEQRALVHRRPKRSL